MLTDHILADIFILVIAAYGYAIYFDKNYILSSFKTKEK